VQTISTLRAQLAESRAEGERLREQLADVSAEFKAEYTQGKKRERGSADSILGLTDLSIEMARERDAVQAQYDQFAKCASGDIKELRTQLERTQKRMPQLEQDVKVAAEIEEYPLGVN